MSQKHLRRMEGVKHITTLEAIDQEISRSETRVLSANDSMTQFFWVFFIALLMGITNIGTAMYNGRVAMSAAWGGLLYAVGAFSVFTLYKFFEVLAGQKPEREYKDKLILKRGEMIRAIGTTNPANPLVPKLPKFTVVEEIT